MTKLLATAALACVAMVPAHAFAKAETAPAPAPIQGAAALKEWNLIVFGDLASSSEVEGRTFVGGNLSGQSSNYSLNQTGVSANGTTGLTVVGNVTGGTKNLQNSSGARVGGDATSGFNLNTAGGMPSKLYVGGSLRNTNVNRPNQAFTNLANASSADYDVSFLPSLMTQKDALVSSLSDLSLSLSGLTATEGSTLSFGSNTATFNAVANAAGYSVFSLDAAQLNSVGQINFQRNGVETVIVNVGGTAIELNDNFLGNSSELGANVLWNFYDATSLNASTAFYGSVLAPKAAGTIGNFIEGSAVFDSLNQNGEIHLGTFQGNVPTFTSAVPEPATWGMMIIGFGAIGGAMRRKTATTARLAYA